MKVKVEAADGAPSPDSTEEWLTHPPAEQSIMSNIMQALSEDNDHIDGLTKKEKEVIENHARNKEPDGDEHQSVRPIVIQGRAASVRDIGIQDYSAVDLAATSTTPNTLPQDATAFYAQTMGDSTVDTAPEDPPHKVTRRWKKKANHPRWASQDPSMTPLNIEQANPIRDDQANPNVNDGTDGSQNPTLMSFQERAAEYARVYGGITTREQPPQIAPNTHPGTPNPARPGPGEINYEWRTHVNQEPAPGEIHRGDPFIYCCFFLRKGHCRWGDRCRYQHFRSYREMDPILQRHQIFGLCHRQIPGNFKYPCKRHHHARYA